jgi:hypothetical protein
MCLDANMRLALGREYVNSRLDAAERDRLTRSRAERQREQRQHQTLLQRALRRPAPAQARAQ